MQIAFTRGSQANVKIYYAQILYLDTEAAELKLYSYNGAWYTKHNGTVFEAVHKILRQRDALFSSITITVN